MNPKQMAPPTAAGTDNITKRFAPDGVPERSRKHRLRIGKVRGESKAARRIRRAGVR